MSLRLKIFTTFLMVTLATVALVAILVRRQFTTEVRASLSRSVVNAEQVVQTVNSLNIDRLIDEAASLSADPRLRASLSTMDIETIAQSVSSFAQAYNAPLLLVLSPQEKYLTGWGLPSTAYGNIAQEPVITDAMNGFEAGDYWAVNGELMMVAAVPVVTGSRTLGMIVLGRPLGDAILSNLKKMTGSDFAIVVDGSVPHITLPNSSLQFQHILAQYDHGATPMEFADENDRFIGARLLISNGAGRELASIVIFESMGSALAALDPLRSSMYIIAAISIGFSLLASYLLALGVTRPVESLAKTIRSFGGGDYHEPVNISTNDEVGLLAKSFEEMRQSLMVAQAELVHTERLSTLGQMANGIIHDFKQPITSIQGFTELICQSDISNQKRTEFGGLILASIAQMTGMIRDLLDFSRGETALHLEMASLNNVVAKAVNTFGGTFHDHQIELRFDPGEVSDIMIDRLRIQRAVENLIGNAGEAIEGTGTISLATRPVFDGIELLVSDTGSGIPLEIQDTLFDPFISLGKPNGTGLGLSVAKNIIEEHGANITFSTKQDVGTRFSIKFPLNGA